MTSEEFIAFSDVYWRRIYDRFEVKPNYIVIDVGAHIGSYTIKVGRTVGPEGKVIAIEPHPVNYEALLQNVAINRLSNVIPVRVCLCNTLGYMKLYLASSSDRHSIVHQKSNQYMEVPSFTLDELLKRLDISHVDIIKIDVEGAELDVLKGSEQSLKKIEKIIVSTYHYADEVHEIAEYLMKQGFRIRKITRYCTLLDSVYGGCSALAYWFRKDIRFFVKYIILRTFVLMFREAPFVMRQVFHMLTHKRGMYIRHKVISELVYAYR